MGMTRGNAVSYLHSQFAALEAPSSTTADDDPLTGYAPAIDDALLMYGTGYDDLPTAEVSTQVDGYRKLLRYHGLQLIESRLLADPSYNPGQAGVTEIYSNRLKQVQSAKEAAKQAAKAAGYNVEGGATSMHEISLDIYEP